MRIFLVFSLSLISCGREESKSVPVTIGTLGENSPQNSNDPNEAPLADDSKMPIKGDKGDRGEPGVSPTPTVVIQKQDPIIIEHTEQVKPPKVKIGPVVWFDDFTGLDWIMIAGFHTLDVAKNICPKGWALPDYETLQQAAYHGIYHGMRTTANDVAAQAWMVDSARVGSTTTFTVTTIGDNAVGAKSNRDPGTALHVFCFKNAE